MEDKVIPVGVVIRSMDRPTLTRALDSVSAQRSRPAEIIVVAACGSGHRPLPHVHPDIQSRLVFAPDGSRLSRPKAGNAGLRATKASWIAFLDDDDEYLPDHLETLWPVAQRFFAAQHTLGRLVYSLAQGILPNGDKADVYGRSFSFVKIWENTILHTMNAIFHRSLLDDGVAFDESFDIHEDWDFWLQCSQKTGFTFVEKPTTLWHGEEGESGCGFGSNLDKPRYAQMQRQVQDKWAKIREQTLSRISQLSREASAAHAQGDVASATRLCQIVLRQDPENVNAANLLGMISLHRGDLLSAHQLMTVAITHAPPHFGLMYNMGLIEEARGDAAAARSWLEKALDLNPAHEGLRRKLGLA